MRQTTNPLFDKETDYARDLDRIQSPTVHRAKVADRKRDIRDLRRVESAREAIAGLDQETTLYGFTKGQFSLIQLITAALEVTGPAHFFLSTWTAANQDVSEVLDFCATGEILSARWLVDLSFTKRSPQLAHRIRQTFGPDAIRVAQNHAKFAILRNDAWQLVIQTSMNLNHNPRFESFSIAHDPPLTQFLETIATEIWARQARTLERQRPGEVRRHFLDEL